MNLNSKKNNYQNQILLHGCIWIFFIFTSLMQFYESPFKINIDFFVQWTTGIVLFYLNYFYFVPKLLLRKRYFKYLAILIILIAIFMSFRLKYTLPDFHEMHPPKMYDISGKEVIRNKNFINEPSFFLKGGILIPYILIILISLIIRILSEYNINQKNELITETDRKTSELIYLRKQINPHFLFNSLNAIYSLANKKSDLVGDAIVTLSELMRYMLYETDNKTVLLEKEINYIKNYIELQKLRLNDIENIHINIQGNTQNKYIEPLLLISFIENAFKYGTDYRGATHVKIKIIITDNNFNFWIENKIEKKNLDVQNSGIGINNIESRLALLYPNAHKLTISEENNLYSVFLNLKLDQIQLY